MVKSSEIFGSHVFGIPVMKRRLPKAIFKALAAAIDNGERLSIEHANVVAHSMMTWAIEKGATHYTHLFQPMTGLTAEKHDAFFTPDGLGGAIEHFTGSELIQSEPDASSFPSGGIRTTFEARGYTAWDVSSPAYVMIHSNVVVLCIPSVFFTYTGLAMDKKTPLLRSVKALNLAASRAYELLNGVETTINASCGCEQEYFLVDRKLYKERPDLLMAGRTVLGAAPAKGQQMDDHYFGSIKDRVLSFMETVEERLYKLGVPCKTRHNEVAPHQFEMAPVFESANLAADHNQLIMEVLKKVAEELDLAVLLHEKPFAKVNGSGKHLNWSMITAEGENLLSPGKEPQHNMTFLYFLVAVVNAVYKHGDLLRSTVASAGNDHRLGANEAPPAIMSVFLGSELSQILNQVEHSKNLSETTVNSIDLGLCELPDIHIDNTDRNRTSPFAFTGNKFEFRALGSSQSVSLPAAILNVAVADSLHEMNKALEAAGETSEKAILSVIKPFITHSRDIRFEGNNYSEEWEKEAAKRGLGNFKTTPEAYAVWENHGTRAFLERMGVLTEKEIDAQYSINLENYSHTIGIESSAMFNIVNSQILPAAFKYQKDVATAIAALRSVDPNSEYLSRQEGFLKLLSKDISELLEYRDNLSAVIDETELVEDSMDEALSYAKKVIPAMEALREKADSLEKIIDVEHWTLPNYHQLLFLM